ncbi:hypothetical protein [Helicobacter sp.]|nr:hypothetical protein [Helicobacter sp.]MDY2585086.1 hypothetical protein [Helicobacter sp.]
MSKVINLQYICLESFQMMILDSTYIEKMYEVCVFLMLRFESFGI